MATPFLGVKLPTKKGRSGFLSPVGGKDAIRQNVLTILTTKPGERVHQPEFGSRLWELVFEPNDFVIEALAQQFIADAIERFEPRVQLIQVLTIRDEAAGEISFVMRYTIRNVANQEETVSVPARREVGFL